VSGEILIQVADCEATNIANTEVSRTTASLDDRAKRGHWNIQVGSGLALAEKRFRHGELDPFEPVPGRQ
jgi:hypothetical protein